MSNYVARLKANPKWMLEVANGVNDSTGQIPANKAGMTTIESEAKQWTSEQFDSGEAYIDLDNIATCEGEGEEVTGSWLFNLVELVG